MEAQVGDRSVHEIRHDFPVLQRVHSGRPLAYLDNAATTQKPWDVIRAVERFYWMSNANVHRALYEIAGEATELYEKARDRVRALLNARSRSEIVFTRGTTESINLVAWAWGMENLREGDEILLTEMEHHSNLIPWQLLARRKGCGMKFIPFDSRGMLELEGLDGLLTDRTRLVSLAHMSNVFGTVNDVARIARAAHQHGAVVLVDAAQSLPHCAVDVQALDCDFLAFSGHKLYGPTGTGVLYGKETLLDAMPPFMGGGEMISAVSLESATWNELPHKFEAGTPNIAGIIGLGAAIEYVESLGMRRIGEYEGTLAARLVEQLERTDGVTVYGAPLHRGSLASFSIDGIHPHDAAQFLDTRGIAVRAGHHCAQPLMRKLGVPASLRASLSFYNTEDEIERLAAGITATREFFGNGI
jgi:cysteine desulfurase/selenocysteine lyase